MTERWLPIPGYEGRYEVSDEGRVRSVDHYARCGPGGRGLRLVVGRVLRPGLIDRWGHVSVALGKGNSVGVHTAVAAAFIGPRPEGLDVAHWNGDGSDNRWRNLIYETRAENNKHKIPNGKSRVSLAVIKRLRACNSRKEALAIGADLRISESYSNNIRLGHSVKW